MKDVLHNVTHRKSSGYEVVDSNVLILKEIGALGGSRTHDLWLRRPTLYPSELRAHI